MESSKRGLVEDVRMWIELGVTRFFDAVRKTIRTIFFLPPKAASTRLSKMSRINTAPSPVSPQHLSRPQPLFCHCTAGLLILLAILHAVDFRSVRNVPLFPQQTVSCQATSKKMGTIIKPRYPARFESETSFALKGCNSPDNSI